MRMSEGAVTSIATAAPASPAPTATAAGTPTAPALPRVSSGSERLRDAEVGSSARSSHTAAAATAPGTMAMRDVDAAGGDDSVGMQQQQQQPAAVSADSETSPRAGYKRDGAETSQLPAPKRRTVHGSVDVPDTDAVATQRPRRAPKPVQHHAMYSTETVSRAPAAAAHRLGITGGSSALPSGSSSISSSSMAASSSSGLYLRSREKNRMHARRSRARKRLMLDSLQGTVDEAVREFQELRRLYEIKYRQRFVSRQPAFPNVQLDHAFVKLEEQIASESASQELRLLQSGDVRLLRDRLGSSGSEEQSLDSGSDADDDDSLDAHPRLGVAGSAESDSRSAHASKTGMLLLNNKAVKREEARIRNRVHARRSRLRRKVMVDHWTACLAIVEGDIEDLNNLLSSAAAVSGNDVLSSASAEMEGSGRWHADVHEGGQAHASGMEAHPAYGGVSAAMMMMPHALPSNMMMHAMHASSGGGHAASYNSGMQDAHASQSSGSHVVPHIGDHYAPPSGMGSASLPSMSHLLARAGAGYPEGLQSTTSLTYRPAVEGARASTLASTHSGAPATFMQWESPSAAASHYLSPVAGAAAQYQQYLSHAGAGVPLRRSNSSFAVPYAATGSAPGSNTSYSQMGTPEPTAGHEGSSGGGGTARHVVPPLNIAPSAAAIPMYAATSDGMSPRLVAAGDSSSSTVLGEDTMRSAGGGVAGNAATHSVLTRRDIDPAGYHIAAHGEPSPGPGHAHVTTPSAPSSQRTQHDMTAGGWQAACGIAGAEPKLDSRQPSPSASPPSTLQGMGMPSGAGGGGATWFASPHGATSYLHPQQQQPQVHHFHGQHAGVGGGSYAYLHDSTSGIMPSPAAGMGGAATAPGVPTLVHTEHGMVYGVSSPRVHPMNALSPYMMSRTPYEGLLLSARGAPSGTSSVMPPSTFFASSPSPAMSGADTACDASTEASLHSATAASTGPSAAQHPPGGGMRATSGMQSARGGFLQPYMSPLHAAAASGGGYVMSPMVHAQQQRPGPPAGTSGAGAAHAEVGTPRGRVEGLDASSGVHLGSGVSCSQQMSTLVPLSARQAVGMQGGMMHLPHYVMHRPPHNLMPHHSFLLPQHPQSHSQVHYMQGMEHPPSSTR